MMTTPDQPNRYHGSMTSLSAHEKVMADLPEADQIRHLARAHQVPADTIPDQLGYLRRDHPETYAERDPTVADVHEWWHIRQRRTFERG